MKKIKGKNNSYIINQLDCYWSLLCEFEERKGISKLDNIQIQNKRAVYIFFNWDDIPIRIGKSVQVRNRLLSYANNPRNWKVFDRMQDDIQCVGVIYTRDEMESLGVELDLLQLYNPIYNYREG